MIETEFPQVDYLGQVWYNVGKNRKAFLCPFASRSSPIIEMLDALQVTALRLTLSYSKQSQIAMSSNGSPELAIEVHKLTFAFPQSNSKLPALKDVDLVLPRGSICIMVGSNGAGMIPFLSCGQTHS